MIVGIHVWEVVYRHVCWDGPACVWPPNRTTHWVAGRYVIMCPVRADGPDAPTWPHEPPYAYSQVSAKIVMKCEPPNRTSASRCAWYATAKPLRAVGWLPGFRFVHVCVAASYAHVIICPEERLWPTTTWRGAGGGDGGGGSAGDGGRGRAGGG